MFSRASSSPVDMPTTAGHDHPFTISSALDLDFGYTPEFLSGTITWDPLATSGGGRQPAEITRAKMGELSALARAGAPLVDRQAVLASCWHQHYDAPRIEFICQFLFAEEFKTSPKLNKSESIKMLVDLNAPFIPFAIFNEHLKRGLLKYKGKTKFPAVNWAKHYSDFCAKVPFGSDLPDDELANQRKSEKLALAIDFWKEATTAHNANVPAAKVLSLSEDEIDKLSGSQFSLSVGGTPRSTSRPPLLRKSFVPSFCWCHQVLTPIVRRSVKRKNWSARQPLCVDL